MIHADFNFAKKHELNSEQRSAGKVAAVLAQSAIPRIGALASHLTCLDCIDLTDGPCYKLEQPGKAFAEGLTACESVKGHFTGTCSMRRCRGCELHLAMSCSLLPEEAYQAAQVCELASSRLVALLKVVGKLRDCKTGAALRLSAGVRPTATGF